MDEVEWWKNFDLNAEVHIAGSFLYDGLQAVGHCRRPDVDDELFSILYHLSVGFERLLKVAIVLAEHRQETDQKAFEEELSTHDTQALLQRIEKSHPFPVTRAQRALMKCLSEFYLLFRYDHFHLETIRDRDRLHESFAAFLKSDSGIKLGKPTDPIPPANLELIRRRVGKVVRALAASLYAVVTELARKHGIFTYELRSESKASMVYQGEAHTLEMEEIALKELLLFLLKRSGQTKLTIVTDNLEPLDFDPPEAVESADAFLKPDGREMLVEMVKALREERHDLKERDELLELLGSRANDIYSDEEVEDMGGPSAGSEPTS